MARILWIEDQAENHLAQFLSPLYIKGHRVIIASDATQAEEKLLNEKFDIVIFDIRIGSGDDPYWENIYNKNKKNHETARLGLHLLKIIFGEKNTVIESQGGGQDGRRVSILNIVHT